MARPINSGGRGLMPGAAAVDVPLSNSGADSERLSLSDGATRFVFEVTPPGIRRSGSRGRPGDRTMNGEHSHG